VRRRFGTGILAVAFCLSLAPSARGQGALSKEELVQKVRDAYARQDVAALESLVYWRAGTPSKADRDFVRGVFDMVLKANAGKTIQRAELVPVPKDQALTQTAGGIRYVVPLPPIAKLVVSFGPKREVGFTIEASDSSMLVGEHGGRYFLDIALPSPVR
jgi:hypothetical protein